MAKRSQPPEDQSGKPSARPKEEPKSAEHAAAEGMQSTLLLEALENLDQGVSVFDDSLRLVAWNKRFLELLEFPPGFAEMHRPFADFIRHNAERGEYGPGDVDQLTEERLQPAQRFELHRFERTRPDGTVIEVAGNPMPGGGFVTTYTDITERKRAEVALAVSESRLAEAQRLGQMGHFRVALDPPQLEWSDQLYRIFGVVRGEFELTPEVPRSQMHPDDLQQYLQALKAVVEDKRPFSAQCRFVRLDGQSIVIALEVQPELGEAGDVVAVFGTAQDITERKRLEEELAQAQKMEAVGQLTGGVAHDFNNLLAVIMGNADLLGRLLDEGDSRKIRAVESILRASRRGAELTQRLLAFSRKQLLDPKLIDLGDMLQAMTELLRRTLGETIDIQFVTASDLWACKADPSQLENALLNLAINARDAMPRGGRLTIETSNAEFDDAAAVQRELEPGQYIVLAVSDTGGGIAADALDHVFEPFFTTKEVGRGSGLGLSMVYGFARQSGGHATIYSEVGQGTTVRLYLPRSGAAEVPEPAGHRVAESVPREETPCGNATLPAGG